MCKKLLILTSFVVALGLVGANVALGHVIEVGIANENDDAEQHLNDNRIDAGSSDLELPYEDGGVPPTDLQVIGVRYAVDIGQGVALTSAYLTLQADKADKDGTLEPVNVIIRGELSLDAAPFDTVANNITDRPTTAASVKWSIPPYTEIGQREQSPDLSVIIQEIINQDGWAAGNGLVLIISDDPDNPSTGLRETEAGPGDDSALLHIEFGPPTDEVWREAEYPDAMGANWAVSSDSAASGLKYLTDNGEGSNTGSATPEWVNTYNFEAAGGDYKILTRVITPTGSDDSLWVRIPTATAQTAEHPDQAGTGWVRFNSIKGSDTWVWDEVHSNDHDDATVIWTLPAGTNALEIAIREDGTQLDGFVITNNLGLDENAMPSSIDPPPVAGAPIPENGAIEVDASALEWIAPDVAVSHKVYLSTDETIDDADLLGETELAIQVAVLDPGVTYWWRVDAIEADGTVNTGEVWSFATIALEAHFPSPADGAADLEPSTQLSWAAGKVVIMHDIYISTDEAAVAARDMTTFKGKLMTPDYDPGELDLFTTYYWAVDQFTPTGTVAGPVWSFSTAEYILVAGDEVALNYDNTADPFVSELAMDVPLDVTAGGVLSDVALRFKGAPSNLSIDEATGTYEIAGAGADIWNLGDSGDRHDEFHYVYRELTGDGSMTVRVTDNGTGSNAWAKGGPMIRQNATGGSANVLGAITGGDGDGGTFQWREVQGEDSDSSRTLTGIAPPYWVRLTRVGNDFTCEMSVDGVTWELEGDNPHTVVMTDPVLIGLAVTSHQAGEIRTFTFDNISIDGNVGAEEVSVDIGSVSGNSAEPVYVALEDLAGNVGMVAYPDPAATRIDQWWNMKVPLAAFADQGVDLTIASKLIFGVGDGTGGGAGAVTVDDVLIVKPVGLDESGDVTSPGDNVLGVPNNANWPGAEHPALAIDNDTGTKYLHFDGETGPSGIQVEPLVGATIVTGLALTTANDAEPRDPASFEVYGSNESINGPYELIASGDVVDFIDATAWPRFTKNATPIAFDNDVEYRFYQVMFPTVRDAGGANSMQIAEVELLGRLPGAELAAAFAFGSRLLDCATYNDPSVNYTMVHHDGDAADADAVAALQYDAARGYGYEVQYPADSPFGDRSGYGVFGPFDDSPNNRGRFGDECPEELYDSFIGAKNFTNDVNEATMGGMDIPSPDPEGIIFRVDVPNGLYRFVAAVGEADNVHAARVLAEDGGSGPPAAIGANHVVLVHNHDQAQQTIGEAEANLGSGVFARVGFDGMIPPLGDGVFPDPVFVDMDENGIATDAGANSPILEVTQGYIRIHQLQGNSNDGPGGPKDVNGGDIVILELWKVE